MFGPNMPRGRGKGGCAKCNRWPPPWWEKLVMDETQTFVKDAATQTDWADQARDQAT